MNNEPNQRDHEFLVRLVEALTGQDVDGLRPIDWTAALASMCCANDINALQDEDTSAWTTTVSEVASMVRRVRMILSAYRETLPVAVAVPASEDCYSDEIPF